MQGELIECSRTLNSRIFEYAICGLGRIGVVVRFTVKVEKSFPNVVITGFPSLMFDSFLEALSKLKLEDRVCSVLSAYQISRKSLIDEIGAFTASATAFTVEGVADEVVSVAESVCGKVNPLVHGHMGIRDGVLSVTPWSRVLSKKDWVYTYPHADVNTGLCNPWCDFVVPAIHFKPMVEAIKNSIRDRGIEKYLMHHSDSHHFMNIDIVISYLIKKMDDCRYPLSIEIPGEQYSYHTGISFECPREAVAEIEDFADEMTNICHTYGGKRYLYGIYSFSKEQLEKQYGREVLNEWQNIKSELDPKNLLNTKVIRMKPGVSFG